MRGTSHITRFWGTLPAALLAAAILVGACDFKLLESPEMPRWGVTITLPLINQTYPFTDVSNDSTIFEGDSNELQIEFDGALDTTVIDPSYLEINLPASAASGSIGEQQNAPNGADFFTAVTESVKVTIALDSLLDASGWPQFSGISFPDAINDWIIPQSIWNNFVANVAINQTVGPFVLVDTAKMKQDYDFIKEFHYVQLSSVSDTSVFRTTVVNNDFPEPIDSIRLQIISDFLFVSHDTTNLAEGGVFLRKTDLASDTLGAEVSMGLSMQVRQASGDVVIAKGKDPKVTFTVALSIGGVDSLAIRTAAVPLVPATLTGLPLPADVQILRGNFRANQTPPINQISLTNLSNTLPFDINFQLTFPNFADTTDTNSLVLGPWLLSRGPAPIDTTVSLAGYMFINPEGDVPIDSFQYQVQADMTEKNVTLQLDGTSLGGFQANYGIGDLYFQKMLGNFGIEFPTVPTTIDKIPTGFTGFQFDRLSLELHLYNEIALPVQLSLLLQGLNARGDIVQVPIVAPVNYPGATSWSGDPAYTVVVLDKDAASTYWLPEGDTLISMARWDTVVTNNGQSIVDVMNMAPDTIKIGGSALIEGRGEVEINTAIWGSFILVAPFAFIIPHTITFLPVDATPVMPMDSSTREQIQTALLSASLTSIVTSNFPIAGNIDMLVSDSTLFPLAFDELDQLTAGIPETVYTTYDTTIYTSLVDALEADSIMGISHIVYYPESSSAGQATARSGIRASRVEFFAPDNDSVPAFWVGRLFDMEIPAAGVDDIWGRVDPDKLGDTTQVIALDAERVNWLTSDKTVYLKPMISFYKTDDARTVQSTNSIEFKAYVSFEMSSDILVPPTEEDTTKVTAGSIPSDSVAVGSTISISLDSVFSHINLKTPVKDMYPDAVSNHTGIASVDVAPDTSDAKKRRVYITGKGVGTAKITVTADDDPEDNADPVAVSFYVTVYQDTSSGPSSSPGLNPAPESPARDRRRKSIPRSTTWLPREQR